jgi:hypothetical protein
VHRKAICFRAVGARYLPRFLLAAISADDGRGERDEKAQDSKDVTDANIAPETFCTQITEFVFT